MKLRKTLMTGCIVVKSSHWQQQSEKCGANLYHGNRVGKTLCAAE